MHRFRFTDSIEYMKNCVAKPVILSNSNLQDLELTADLSLIITLTDRIITVKDSQFKSSMLPTLGIAGLLKKKLVEGLDITLNSNLRSLLIPLIKANLSHFIFFLESDEKESESIIVTPLFDMCFDPIEVGNTPEQLNPYLCTSHFPIEPNKDYDVIDFDQAPSDKWYRLNLARPEDITKPFYPVVHNTSLVSFREKWEQRASIYDRERDLYFTLPRNFAKGVDWPVGDILSHIDGIIAKLNISQDYDKEFTEMLMAKLPKSGIKFMSEAPFEDHKLETIIDYISTKSSELRMSVLKATYRCLGFMIAQKLHCCPECRHLDEETL